MHPARPWMCALTLAALAAGGCDSRIRYEHATVHGKVTYNGKPVPFGQVLFVPVDPPKDGFMQPASGSIGEDGAYTLKSEADAGAIVGDHKVVVLAVDPGKTAEAPKDPDAAPSPAGGPGQKSKAPQFKSLVPKQYGDPGTTPLTKKVAPGDNTIDIDIKD